MKINHIIITQTKIQVQPSLKYQSVNRQYFFIESILNWIGMAYSTFSSSVSMTLEEYFKKI